MLILGIETSCDETAAAVVKDGHQLLSSALATSLDIHIKYGGVVPDIAAREQLQSILPVLNEAIAPLGRSPFEQIDAIAVTSGPGLIGSLLIGVETAKALAYSLNKPLIPVNHLVGHIYANWLTSGVPDLKYHESSPPLPALVLLVSGNHSDIVLMKAHGVFDYLGSTKDDAAGECFDKCGRLLGLPYPYGPYIEGEASKFHISPASPGTARANSKLKIKLPRPLIHSKGWDFSFSGLKTAFLYLYQREEAKGEITDEFKQALAYELQEAATDVLITKFGEAADTYPVKSLILCGGVAANRRLREKLQKVSKTRGVPAFIPAIKLCTDNAAYIAAAAYYNQNIVSWKELNTKPAVSITSPAS